MGLNTDLLQMLLDAGYKKKDVFHYWSDLYVFKNKLTTKIIKEWCVKNDYSFDWSCKEFRDQITGFAMYDVAFQWHPLEEMRGD